MGIVKKPAKGPNPLSVPKKKSRDGNDGDLLKKRRKRSGKRSKELSELKKRQKLDPIDGKEDISKADDSVAT
jgi:hypothetical protein